MSFTVKLDYNNCSYQKHSNYHVKFTDSSLKSLEELYSRNSKAVIKLQFDGAEGLLQVPIKHTEGKDPLKLYSFSFAPESKDGSTDCFGWALRSSLYKHIGTFTHKLVIRASDDVFQNTLEKMSLAELELKKSCVKEIKFRDHEKKLAHFKSKHSLGSVEPKKMPVIPKPKKPESTLRPGQSSSTVDALDFTARKNNRIIPAMKRPAPEPLQHSSPANSLPDISQCSQHSSADTPVETVVEKTTVPEKKARVSQKMQDVVSLHEAKDVADSQEVKDASNSHESKDVSNSPKKNEADVPDANAVGRDYSSSYPPITTEEELDLYTTEFNRDYEVYINLHGTINGRLQKFKELRDALQLETFKSEAYNKILVDIYNEYSQLAKNQQHVEERKQCLEMHARLEFIKSRITDYDLENELSCPA